MTKKSAKKKVAKKPARPRYRSRATRLADAVGAVRNALSEVESMIPLEEDEADKDDKLLAEIKDRLDPLTDTGEFEGLMEEITTWKENIEEKFSQTQKYSDLEECESSLQDGINDLENAGEVTDWDDLSDVISNIESAMDNFDNVSFPRMFG